MLRADGRGSTKTCYVATFVCQGVGVAWSSKQSKMTQPDLDFVAPDIQLAPTTTTTTTTTTSTTSTAAAAATSADVFSYGLLVCAVFADSGVTYSGVTGDTCTPTVCWSVLRTQTQVWRVQVCSLVFRCVQV